MLHILFLILKIIGFILAIILGLILVVVLFVLFAPMKYRLDIRSKGTQETTQADLRFHWLYHLISGYFCYKDQNVDWQIRIAWKKLNVEESVPENLPVQKETIPVKEEGEKPLRVKEEESRQYKSEKTEAETRSAPKKVEKRKEKSRKSIQEKFKELLEKIKQAVCSFCNKIKQLKEKKEKIYKFLQNETHKRAFGKVKEEFIRALKILKPKYLRGEVYFGFEDPSVTGKTLAWLSMFYPWYGKNLNLYPDFHKKILEGELELRGKLRSIQVLLLMLRLLIHKDVRMTYQHIRKFKL